MKIKRPSKNKVDLSSKASTVKISNGVVMDEYIPALQGQKSKRIYREMRDNDPTVGGALGLIESLICSLEWNFSVVGDGSGKDLATTPRGKSSIEWVRGALFKDMEISWSQFLIDVLSMLTFGWSWFEIVYKIRKGENQGDPRFRSIFSDGSVGVRNLIIKSQEALDTWDITTQGEVRGINYLTYNSFDSTYLSVDKSLYFKTMNNLGNPEGRSILRNAYKSWFFLNNIQVSESIGIERNLSGIPAIFIPGEILNSDDPDNKAAVEVYKSIIQNLRMNERAGVLLPSDPYTDQDGNPMSIPKVRFEIISSSSQRVIDTNMVISRYQKDIARAMMADFILLGTFRQGSYALSTDKTDMFQKSIKYIVDNIADTINKQLIRKLWRLNNFNMSLCPILMSPEISKDSVQALVGLVEALGRAGAPIFPDDDLENSIRSKAGLPLIPEDREKNILDWNKKVSESHILPESKNPEETKPANEKKPTSKKPADKKPQVKKGQKDD